MTSITTLQTLKRVIVFGGAGMLGTEVTDLLRSAGHDVISLSFQEFDITFERDLKKFEQSEWGSRDWAINCAAYTQVDKAESENMACLRINGMGPGLLAAICKLRGTRFLHFSTDFVFDGLSNQPYKESDHTNPLSIYGKSKILGEQNALRESEDSIILRTSWLYGSQGPCFPRTMIKAWLAGKTLRVVDDQTGCPTYSRDLAQIVVDIVNSPIPGGIYHATGNESMTWRDFAELAIKAYADRHDLKTPVHIEGIPTSEYQTPAQRPAYSVLNCEKLFNLGYRIGTSTKQSLADFCQRLDIEREF